MKPKLISFKLCPFVQRVNIVLQTKAVDYELVYVDLSNPPEWLKILSPFGRVPLLQVDEGVIFETVAIVEYLEERYNPKLLPNDIFLKAINRSWIEESNEITWIAFHLTVKESEDEFTNVCDELTKKLDRIETSLNCSPYFNGESFSAVDASYSPFFQRVSFLEELRPGIIDCARHPKVCNWREALLSNEIMHRSHVPELKSMYFELVAKRKGYISRFLDCSKYDFTHSKSVY